MDDGASVRARAHSAAQLRLLRAVWPLLKPGGELLYTTCSILAAENDGVVGTFLFETADAMPADVHRSLPPPVARLEAPPHAPVHAEARPHGGVVFFPSSAHQGGFVALLRKRAS